MLTRVRWGEFRKGVQLPQTTPILQLDRSSQDAIWECLGCAGAAGSMVMVHPAPVLTPKLMM